MVNNQYYITETDVSKMLRTSGLPILFQNLFVRDYVAIKRELTGSADRIDIIEGDIASLDIRIGIAENDIDALELRITTAESDINNIENNLEAHVVSSVAHGSSGDIVGNTDWCSGIQGGVVLLAAAVTDATASAVTAVLNPNAAGVAYLQADAATWVAMLNEHKANINQLKTDLNAAITQLNLLLANSRTAKQLEP